MAKESLFKITLKVFLWKTIKEKRFHWKKNVFFTLLPIVILLFPFFFDSNAYRNDYDEPENIYEPETEIVSKLKFP
jgi:hypothetical protein